MLDVDAVLAQTVERLPVTLDDRLLAQLLSGRSTEISDQGRSLHLAIVPLEDAGKQHIGDLVVILLFTLIGRQEHSMLVGLEGFLATVNTAAPYLLAWVVVAPLLGAYRPRAWMGVASTITSLLIAFIPAVIVGSLLRALFIGRFSPPIFYLVTAGFLVLMLLAWRLLFTLLLAPQPHEIEEIVK